MTDDDLKTAQSDVAAGRLPSHVARCVEALPRLLAKNERLREALLWIAERDKLVISDGNGGDKRVPGVWSRRARAALEHGGE